LFYPKRELLVKALQSKIFRRGKLMGYAFLVTIFLASANSIFAIPLARYRQNVTEAGALLSSLEILKQNSAGADFSQAERTIIQNVRRKLPPHETIEFGGLSLQADNSWLEKDLQNYEKLASTSPHRTAFMQLVIEKLNALESRLGEIENAQNSARGKNEDKQKLDEILRRPEFQKPSERDKSVLGRWWDSVREWWRNLFRREAETIAENAPNTDYTALASILRYGVIILAFGVIVYVVWRFALPMMQRNRKTKIRLEAEPRIVLGETLKPDETAVDLFAQAEYLASQGEVRAAIRKGYIALLCELSDRKIIGLARHKTNRDYLRDLQKQGEVFQPMRVLTNSFEQHWYGRVPAGDEDWNTFRGNYQQALQEK
jgi:hypothetical protein